jgi:uncharacterized linocin/CFP29 family protein
MNWLLREQAPIPPEAWQEIEAASRRTLAVDLAARRLVDVVGPLGWEHASVATGRAEPLDAGPLGQVDVRRRSAQPLIEVRTLPRAELEDLARGARDLDLAPVIAAAECLAQAENRAVFHGFAAGEITGIAETAQFPSRPIAEDDSNLHAIVVDALELLRSQGVAGPYGLALAPRTHAGLMKAHDQAGFPILERIEKLLGGPIVRAPALDGALVVSLRGGDFELTLGQDVALGYAAHTRESVQLYLIESFAFRTLTPEAAVLFVHPT